MKDKDTIKRTMNLIKDLIKSEKERAFLYVLGFYEALEWVLDLNKKE